MIGAPAEEIIGHLDMLIDKEEAAAKKEQMLKWTDFLIAIYSNPPSEGESAELRNDRQRFIDSLQPKGSKPKPKEYKWNIPEEEILKAQLLLEEGGEEDGDSS